MPLINIKGAGITALTYYSKIRKKTHGRKTIPPCAL